MLAEDDLTFKNVVKIAQSMEMVAINAVSCRALVVHQRLINKLWMWESYLWFTVVEEEGPVVSDVESRTTLQTNVPFQLAKCFYCAK